MSFDQVWKSITGVPAVDLKDHRYKLVKFNTDGKVVPAAAGEKAVGVNYEPNNIDEPSQVVASGFAFVILGADLAAGTTVMSDANGAAVAHVAGTDPAINYELGVLAVGGATGDIATIFLG